MELLGAVVVAAVVTLAEDFADVAFVEVLGSSSISWSLVAFVT